MCFIIDKNHKRRKTAKEDITCYKVMNRCFTKVNVFKSTVRGYEYKLNKLVRSKLQRPIFGEINKGLHSYSTIQHAFGRRVVIQCIIPKGAKYYYSERHREYVSNKIIPVEVIY